MLICLLYPSASSAAPNLDAAQVVRNFLESMRGDRTLGAAQRHLVDKPYPHLTHLLAASTTVPMVQHAPEDYIDNLLGLLPSTVVVLASGAAEEDATKEPTPAAAQAAIAALSLSEKRSLLHRVLHSPQFQQSLVSLTQALRDGGLPDVAAALGIMVRDGGRLQGGMPIGGGEAVEAFVEGIKRTVQENGGS